MCDNKILSRLITVVFIKVHAFQTICTAIGDELASVTTAEVKDISAEL